VVWWQFSKLLRRELTFKALGMQLSGSSTQDDFANNWHSRTKSTFSWTAMDYHLSGKPVYRQLDVLCCRSDEAFTACLQADGDNERLIGGNNSKTLHDPSTAAQREAGHRYMMAVWR